MKKNGLKHQMEKRIFSILLIGLGFAFLKTNSYATDYQAPIIDNGKVEIIHNEQKVDPFTGEIITEDQEEEKEEEQSREYQSEYFFGDSVYYDVIKDQYVYRFGSVESESVYCNVANGMYTNDPVRISFGNGIRYQIYLNGNKVEEASLNQLEEPGNYVIWINSLDDVSLGTFYFTITDVYTNCSVYQIPEYFSIVEATCNGVIQYGNTTQISMEEEGQYQIIIQNNENKMTYSYQAIVDHTAPTLKLEAVNEKMLAKSAVDISDLEENVDIQIFWNDEIIEYKKVLTTPGKYTLVLTDAAGNRTTYSFVIYLYFTVTSTVILFLIGLAIAGLVVYLIVSRKSIRVR